MLATTSCVRPWLRRTVAAAGPTAARARPSDSNPYSVGCAYRLYPKRQVRRPAQFLLASLRFSTAKETPCSSLRSALARSRYFALRKDVRAVRNMAGHCLGSRWRPDSADLQCLFEPVGRFSQLALGDMQIAIGCGRDRRVAKLLRDNLQRISVEQSERRCAMSQLVKGQRR
jgi:hypothetical protein